MDITIYQINMGRDHNRIAFEGLDLLKMYQGSDKIDSRIYDRVFEGEVDCKDLEDVYRKFNLEHPEGYKGRSLSVSDVVEIVDENGDSTFHFCDSIGFKQIDFDPYLTEEYKEDKIKVVLCEPGKVARVAEISNTLAGLQKTVKGDIEQFCPYEEAVAIIQKPLGNKYMTDVTPDDVNLAILPALSMSESVYRSAQMLYKLIFTAAEDSNVIKKSPCSKLSAKGGKPQKVKKALSDEQVEKLLTAIKDLPPYVFVMIGLYCGLRREEILALQWDCVFLDVPAPYLSVKRAWHTEHNRPVILDELKTSAAKRDIPIPPPLADCLKEVKAKSQSPFVVANRDGEPLSYTQFQRVWKYIVTRSNKERTYVRYVNGQKIKHTVTPVLGEKAPHNGKVVYSLDFQVTPHQLRHTYVTNLIYAGVDPKTVQYLAGHENSKITMDIYAKVKYNSPDALSTIVNNAFNNMYAKAE